MARAPVNAAAWPAWRTRAQWLASAAAVRLAEAEVIAGTIAAGRLPGSCGLCGRATDFVLGAAPAPLREGLLCGLCRCNARQRAAAMALLQALPHAAAARVYATEQASPLFVALRRRVGTLVGSEFGLSLRTRMHRAAWLWRQGARVWLRHEDVTALRIGTASVDAVLSLDVLEHVSEHSRALREFARVLKPGGSLLLTVPFYEDAALGTRITRTDDSGAIEHLGAPEFHGDPLSGGALCFHHFGWDLLDAMRAAGFSDAHACRVQAAGHGVPQGQWVLRARR